MDESPQPSSASFVPEQKLTKENTNTRTSGVAGAHNSNNSGGSPRADSQSSSSVNNNSTTATPAPVKPSAAVFNASPTKRTLATSVSSTNVTNVAPAPTSPSSKSKANMSLGLDDEDDHFNNANGDDDDEEKFVEKIGPLEFTRAKYDAMCQNLKVQAKWHDTRHQLKTIKNVMNGEELTLWFMANGYVSNVEEAVIIGKFLIQQQVLYPMLKRLAPRGFVNTHDLFYMLTPEREEKNIVSNAFSKVKNVIAKDQANKMNPFTGKEPVRYVQEGYHVEAIVYECERYSGTMAAGLTFSRDNLQENSDPPNFSCKPEDVPIPSVGNASPDLCEWIDEWVHVVDDTGKTDPEGWMYGENFATLAQNNSPKFNVHEHRVRARAWHRYARKIPDVKEITVEEEVQESQKEIEERAHREMLERIEKARRARQKFYFQWTIEGVQLKQDISPNSIFVVVEHFATRHRSNVAAQRPSRDPGYADFPLADCTGQFEVTSTQIVGFAVWANLSLGRKVQLGYASFLVPEKQAEDAIELTDQICDINDKENRTIGLIKFEWGMAPVPKTDEELLDELEGTNNRASSVLHTPHCVLELSVVSIDDVDSRIVERSRGSRFRCLAFFAPAGEPRAFLRIKYRGLVSNMTLESGRVILSEGQARFDFSTFLAVRHLIPVTVELWYERGTPGKMSQELIGEVKLEFIRSGLETCTNEKPVAAAPDMAAKIYQKQLDALPPEAKPKAPPPPENPHLEELLNQVRKSQAARASVTMTEAEKKKKEELERKIEEKKDAAESKQVEKGENIYGNLTNEANENVKKEQTAEEIAKEGGIPTVMTKACTINIRYKYVVEGEEENVFNAADLAKKIDDELKEEAEAAKKNSALSNPVDENNGSNNTNKSFTTKRPSAAPADGGAAASAGPNGNDDNYKI